MVRPITFEVEQWMDQYETTPGVLNVAETCASSISIDELTSLSGDKDAAAPFRTSTRLTYGPIWGSPELRRRVAELHTSGNNQPLNKENVIITQGGIGANFLTLFTLLGPSDHVICVYPTYQQLYSVPESLGAQVSLWKLRAENGFIPDCSELQGMSFNLLTSPWMIIINNPNNPSGILIPKAVLGEIVEFARARDIIVMSDEVYRPLFHQAIDSGAELPPPITSFGYNKTIVTGSMSKAWAMAGIRIGWIVTPSSEIMGDLAAARDYTTISVSQVDDQIATYALAAARGPLSQRNVRLAVHNLGILEAFINQHSSVCDWVRPNAGTTAFIRFKNKKGEPVDDVSFCLDLLQQTKILLVPGSKCFGSGSEDFAGYVRFGYVCETAVLEEALPKLAEYIKATLV
ncbi:hypothetical protein NLG97_g2246 [Lecanicillium saksenae]|uniref:Uncharacterized protein n=1 Tax=Lecanicillium saksenae TaxID=468837 RepID=A0ACC1R1P1_9HYPO|nr:hypothetical protein NLG97_g2246 [Lecanicillium saksenae]